MDPPIWIRWPASIAFASPVPVAHRRRRPPPPVRGRPGNRSRHRQSKFQIKLGEIFVLSQSPQSINSLRGQITIRAGIWGSLLPGESPNNWDRTIPCKIGDFRGVICNLVVLVWIKKRPLRGSGFIRGRVSGTRSNCDWTGWWEGMLLFPLRGILSCEMNNGPGKWNFMSVCLQGK